MKISQYIIEYTNGDRVTLLDVVLEIKEFIDEVVKFDQAGMAEEFEDVLHFVQLWLYWRFRIDGETWNITQNSVSKFMARKDVWNIIYKYVGLPADISGYVGNYNKMEKVINHLQRFNIDAEQAKAAYNKIILKK